MKTADTFSNCRQLENELRQIESSLTDLRSEKQITQREIEQLQNAKIATRLEFGNAADIETIRQREQALREMEQTLSSRQVDLVKIDDGIELLEAEAKQSESTFISLGCRNII